MKKRGLSTVVVTLIMVLLVIVLISVVWVVVKNLISSESEVAEARSKFFSERVDIKNVNVNNLDVNLSLTKVGGRIVSIEPEVISGALDVDLISVVDLSGSMYHNCVPENPSTGWRNCTCSPVATVACCSDIGGGVYDPGSGNCSLFTDFQIGDKYKNCSNICGGEWLNTPLRAEQDANKLLVNSILGQIGSSKIGLVAYHNYFDPVHSIDLTDNPGDLNAVIDGWVPPGSTCICCGIRNATNWLSFSSRDKVMIVMSDGGVTTGCSSGTLTENIEETIQEACDAKIALPDLIIHSVGLSLPSGLARETLVNISRCGGGQYYEANNFEELADAYQAIADSVIQTYSSITQFNFLRVVFYGSPGSVVRDVEVPNILEIKNYDFQLSSV
ncbi:MAG: VWA domain-containing protein, partial [Thaumarchaeota archaeon]|nr:VWA domain-containing protein [Nitrososphaerota archaeon]